MITQNHSLKVYVTNTSKDVADVKLKHIFFGRNLKDHSVDKINEGEKEAQVKPLATEMVEVPMVTSTYTEEHYEIGGGGSGGGKAGGKARQESGGFRFAVHRLRRAGSPRRKGGRRDLRAGEHERRSGQGRGGAEGQEIKAQAPKGAKK